MFGYRTEEVIGKSILTLGLFDLTDKNMVIVEEQLRKNGKYTSERIAHKKTGTFFFASVTLNTVNNTSGEIVAFVVGVKDVSHSKELERKLSKVQ